MARLKIVYLDAIHCPVPTLDIPDHSYVEYQTTSIEQIDDRIKDVDILITTCVPLSVSNIEKCPNLRLISVMAAGTDPYNSIKPVCKARGITIQNIPSASADSVAEHVFALYFAVKRKVVEMHELTMRDEWPVKRTARHTFGPLPTPCSMEVMGIIGYGSLGRRIEKIAKLFGMEVVAAERKGQDVTRLERENFYETLKRCTLLILTCPLDDSTRGMIDETELKLMNKKAIIINVARGGVMVEEALVRALREGWIGGAATDVFAKEPADASNSPLISRENPIPNLTLSPHVAWYNSSTLENLQFEVKRNVEMYVAGQIRNAV